MANGVVVQLAVLLVAVFACFFMLYKKRQVEPAQPTPNVSPFRPSVQQSQSSEPMPAEPMPAEPMPAQRLVVHKTTEADRQLPPTIPVQSETVTAPVNTAPEPVAAPAAALVDVQSALATQEDRNEQMLAGISKNIQKTLQMRPVPQHSPIPYPEPQRNTEYVRVKKAIITPHGHIRFSILKDWVSTNMLAVFRRASLEWKTPEDLIAFLPAYLEAEAEILSSQVLLIGTPGHDEKVAVPIRSLDDASGLQGCFDFTDSRTATNTPAVVRVSDTEFEVVSRGLITKTVFTNAVDRSQDGVQLLMPRSPEALQESYSAALRP
jgi:hypothetical protein